MIMTAIKENIEQVRERISAAAQRSGRTAADVAVVAVTKSADVGSILEAQQAGITTFAENRVQDAMEKVPQVPGVQWHMVGHLQSNKIKTALGLSHCIQSVDSVRLAKEINQHLLAEDRLLPVLLEVNISGEKQKFGFEPEQIYSAVEEFAPLTQILVQGVMGIAPNVAEEGPKRAAFKKLKNIFIVLKGLKRERLQMQTLSMGMSDDFEVAVEEGSNMLRLGRAIFNSPLRPPSLSKEGGTGGVQGKP